MGPAMPFSFSIHPNRPSIQVQHLQHGLQQAPKLWGVVWRQRRRSCRRISRPPARPRCIHFCLSGDGEQWLQGAQLVQAGAQGKHVGLEGLALPFVELGRNVPNSANLQAEAVQTGAGGRGRAEVAA